MLTPHLGVDPWPPARKAASPSGRRSPLLGLVAPSLQLSEHSSRAAMVMRTGYRAPNRTQVVAAFIPSTNFMFHIYRGPLHPLWVGASRLPPALRSLPPPPLPRLPPSVFSLDWFSWLFSCGLGPTGGHFLIVLGHLWRCLFIYTCLA